MEVWRLASSRHPGPSGEGARLVGGRWTSPGRPVIYASESLALCLAEALVHVTGSLPADYVAHQIEVPDNSVERLDTAAFKPDWHADVGYTRAIGDQWLDQARSVSLLVPSAVVPASTNVLINPAHASFDAVRIVASTPFRFDPRLG